MSSSWVSRVTRPHIDDFFSGLIDRFGAQVTDHLVLGGSGSLCLSGLLPDVGDIDLFVAPTRLDVAKHVYTTSWPFPVDIRLDNSLFGGLVVQPLSRGALSTRPDRPVPMIALESQILLYYLSARPKDFTVIPKVKDYTNPVAVANMFSSFLAWNPPARGDLLSRSDEILAEMAATWKQPVDKEWIDSMKCGPGVTRDLYRLFDIPGDPPRRSGAPPHSRAS